jgi:hypothetical protein
MKVLDEKGRLFGKLSLLDLLIVIIAVGLLAGFLYKRMSGEVVQLVNANDKFYVTIAGTKLREFSVNAIAENDVMYRQHDREPLGKVVKLTTEPATEYMLKTDGTALAAPMEERFTAYITLECTGSITPLGYYFNGVTHIAEGNEIVLVSNRVQINETKVSYVGTEMPS